MFVSGKLWRVQPADTHQVTIDLIYYFGERGCTWRSRGLFSGFGVLWGCVRFNVVFCELFDMASSPALLFSDFVCVQRGRRTTTAVA